jgi:hypothetical protein
LNSAAATAAATGSILPNGRVTSAEEEADEALRPGVLAVFTGKPFSSQSVMAGWHKGWLAERWVRLRANPACECQKTDPEHTGLLQTIMRIYRIYKMETTCLHPPFAETGERVVYCTGNVR